MFVPALAFLPGSLSFVSPSFSARFRFPRLRLDDPRSERDGGLSTPLGVDIVRAIVQSAVLLNVLEMRRDMPHQICAGVS